MIRQELNPETCRLDEKQIKEKRQVRDKGVPLSYHHGKAVSSLVDDCQTMHPPPALKLELERERTKEEKEREVLHLFRCYTHTHPAGAGSTLKGKRKKKADTRRADGQKQRRGGRGTDGPPEPTYTAKRTWPKQRTHLNPTTRYGEAHRERLGTKWGTSWCQTKNKTII